MRYIYLGDRLTDPQLVGMECAPVRRADGRCIVGKGSALVVDKWGRRLRLTEKFYHDVRPLRIAPRRRSLRRVPLEVKTIRLDENNA